MKQLLHLLVFFMLGMCVLSSKTVANEKIHSLVTQKAIEHNVPPAFAHGVIITESNYNPNAKNGSSIGLGQIQCRTAKGIGLQGDCKRLYDPETNLSYSMKYLRMALDRAKGNQCYAATLYNRGLGAKPADSKYCKKVFSKVKSK